MYFCDPQNKDSNPLYPGWNHLVVLTLLCSTETFSCQAHSADNGSLPYQGMQHCSWAFQPCPSGRSNSTLSFVANPRQVIYMPSDWRLG